MNCNGACVYNPDHTWYRACMCYTRDAPFTQSATWVSDHCYSTAQFSYCFANPLCLQLLYLLLVPPACWYKLNCNRVNDHKRLFLFSASAPSNPPFHPVGCCDCRWLPMIAGDCAMTLAFHVLQKICRIKISLQFISTFGCNIVLPL